MYGLVDIFSMAYDQPIYPDILYQMFPHIDIHNLGNCPLLNLICFWKWFYYLLEVVILVNLR